MEEGGHETNASQYGPFLLRNSMRFNSLSEVVAGLEIDENCQALVN